MSGAAWPSRPRRSVHPDLGRRVTYRRRDGRLAVDGFTAPPGGLRPVWRVVQLVPTQHVLSRHTSRRAALRAAQRG